MIRFSIAAFKVNSCIRPNEATRVSQFKGHSLTLVIGHLGFKIKLFLQKLTFKTKFHMRAQE